MRRYQKFFATLIFVVVGLVVFVVGGECAVRVGELTNSGLLGICGPYGEHSGLVAGIFLGSFPIAIFAGMVASRIFKHLIANQANA